MSLSSLSLDLALAFSFRPNTTVVVASLRIWRRVYQTHLNAAAFAAHYHSSQLGYKTMLAWRLRLREMLKKEKQARIAERFLLSRRCWKSWKNKLEDAKRDKKVVLWQKAKLKVSFEREQQHY
jgi:protein SFI1